METMESTTGTTLQPGTYVYVLTTTGVTYEGTVAGKDATGLSVKGCDAVVATANVYGGDEETANTVYVPWAAIASVLVDPSVQFQRDHVRAMMATPFIHKDVKVWFSDDEKLMGIVYRQDDRGITLLMDEYAGKGPNRNPDATYLRLLFVPWGNISQMEWEEVE